MRGQAQLVGVDRSLTRRTRCDRHMRLTQDRIALQRAVDRCVA